MAMLDSFFNKGFKAAKCKTLLKLTTPRIKLLRNRREVQIKLMRRDIAKLLQTGQEATARIRVEHIIREENMMAAQEILELFCELIAVRLPIIEIQRECPLDLKEAISSVCFAAPRCADLPELLQVQMLFAAKYGKEFVAAATELMPDCGVNRQLIELLSVRAPSPETKLKLLKEIAEEHELDWDPTASETEFLKPHEDLLNGPAQFVSGSKLPLPKEKHDDTLNSASDDTQIEEPDSDIGLDPLDFPEVPKVVLRPTVSTASAPELGPLTPAAIHNINLESSIHSEPTENLSQESYMKHENVIEETVVATKDETPSIVRAKEEKQFVPFISPPSQSSTFSAKQNSLSPSVSRAKSEANVDLQDVLAAAQAAAETAERAATAARSAATLAHARITELTKKNSEKFPETGNENPFHTDMPDQPATNEKPYFHHQDSFGDIPDQSAANEKPYFHHQDSFGDNNGISCHPDSHHIHEDRQASHISDLPSFDKLKLEPDSPNDYGLEHGSAHHQPQRLASMDDDYYSYPNLFNSQHSNLGSSTQSVLDNTHITHDH